MTKRQRRLQRIAAVAEEYLAAVSAAKLLGEKLKGDPNYGVEWGWTQRAGEAFAESLEATYIVRIYAEFEAGLRDYWKTYCRQSTYPTMRQLVNEAIPNQRFSQERIDRADEVRLYRNFLIHDIEDEPPDELKEIQVAQAKKHLCAYFACLDPNW